MARGGGGSRGGGSRGGGGFSSGGARSSRGFSSSSSGSRGGGFSSGPRPYSGGGPRPHMSRGPRPTPPPPMMGYRPRAPRRTVYVSSPRRVYRSGGCMSNMISWIIAAIILMAVFSMITAPGGYGGYGDGTKIESTLEREPLPSGSVIETGYFTDNLGFIDRSSALKGGMKKFYQETGVQPYLYLASEDEIVEYGSLQALTEIMYDELFTDEAHLLFSYTENANYEWEIWFVTGSQATAVIDTEAEEIIYQYFLRYINNYDLDYEEVFSRMFEDSAELMMKKITNGFDVAKVAILVVGTVAIVGIVIYGANKNRKIKLEEQKEQNEFTERMMNVPLEKFSESEADKELEELMKKYNDSQSKL